MSPEEFYKELHGEEPPKIFTNTSAEDVFLFAEAYGIHKIGLLENEINNTEKYENT